MVRAIKKVRAGTGSLLLMTAAGVVFGQTPKTSLTLAQATEIALKNHPQVLAARNQEYAANQRIIEQRAAYYPRIFGNITASQGYTDSRIGAGDLAASRLFNRQGEGLEVNQLITDFGRTKNLVSNASLEAQATAQVTKATRYSVLLAVNQAYYEVLQAQAYLQVANETIKTRQTVLDQISALAKAQLKSQVDVSFAQVNVTEAKLILIRSEDSLKRAQADLARSLGVDSAGEYELVEDQNTPGAPGKADELIDEAIKNRPELEGSRLQLEATRRFEAAERDLQKPVLSAVAVGGAIPYIDAAGGTPIPTGYEGVAVNMSIPIFTGHSYSARREEAHYKTVVQSQRVRDLQQQIERDVKTSLAAATTAYERIPVSEELVKQTHLSLILAQGRYNLGLASIVEVTQAQLSVTQAEIEHVSAIYDYKNTYATLLFTTGALR